MKLGRNDACPCGSGLKYKRCCLAKEAMSPVSTRRAEGPAPLEPRGHITDPSGLSPYSLARTFENAMRDGEISPKLFERHGEWTISKVAALTTEAIEKKLEDLGVPQPRESLGELAEDRESAWSIGRSWFQMAGVHNHSDVDFVTLAACELWKRLLPDRPSTEMIDDWMQLGYEHDMYGRPLEAIPVWSKTWETLRSRFTPEIRTMDAAEAVFSGTQLIFNWCQDFELSLTNASIASPEAAALGKQYCAEWLEQFPDERGSIQVGFRHALAQFQFRLGEIETGEATLHATVERWPEEYWGYVALAEAYGHFWQGDPAPEYDIERALAYLERALEVARTDEERSIVLERRGSLEQKRGE